MPTLATTLEEGRKDRRFGGTLTRAPHLFVVVECDRPLAGGARYSTAGIDTVTLGRDTARRARRPEPHALEVGIPDGWMSRRHARVDRALSRWIIEDLGSRNGTYVNGERVERGELRSGDVVELGHTLFAFRDNLPTPTSEPLDVDFESGSQVAGLATLIPALSADIRELETIAEGAVEVMIRGESGTGKELIARAVHRLSGRAGPFVAVNCGAIPSTLVESQLFGHEQGAFSGADRAKPGLIRSAHKGSLFLDEIGDLAPASQAALLRALQEREVLPVGGTKPVPVDIRLISATHHDLEARTEQGEFRDDLLGRIAGHAIHLPPLRERREDLGVLVASLLPRAARGRGGDAPPFALTAEAARLLLAHTYPRNIRQLEKALTVALSLAGAEAIGAHHLPADLREPAAAAAAEPKTRPPARPLSAAEQDRKARIEALLAEHAGNVSAVARAMGKGRTQIQRWIHRYGLDPDAFRSA